MTERQDKTKPFSATVVVLEPDILARATIAEYLRGCGYKVIESVSAAEVITVLDAAVPVHVILTEVRLTSELEGLDLAKHVRQKHPGIDVILTVGIANAAEKAGELCNEAPLEKPYNPQELVKRIQRLREQRRTALPP
jgi:DNA-binding NtrC family response regulator